MYRFRPKSLPVFAVALALAVSAHAQQSFLRKWQARASATQAEQPHWVTPLATTTPRLEQEFRADLGRQLTSDGATTWTYGSGKGLELIPARRIELLFNLPPYIQHNSPAAKDGFGDTTLLMKYRVYARNEQHGNAIVTAFFGGSIPTGSDSNGSTEASVSPTLAVGKGFGRFDAQSTAGVTLPVADTKKLGRPVVWNTAFQVRTGRFFPELEVNSTFYEGGPHDGKIQTFLTPGLVGHWKIRHRLGLTLGAGMQIAASDYHSYNHGLILSARLPF